MKERSVRCREVNQHCVWLSVHILGQYQLVNAERWS